MPQEPDLEVTENTLNSWACQVLPLRDTQSNRELAINNLAATVSCGRTVESFDKGKFNISDVKNVLLRGTEEALPSNTKLDLLTPALFFDLCRLLPHAVVFATDDVHFGLSSSAALVGDEIWVVLGFRFPLLIRPVEDSKYRVVGPCYVPQLSNGEAVLGPLPDGWKVMFHPSGSPHFVAPDGSGTIQDPRLEKELPPGWEQKESPDHSQLLWKRTEDENWRTLDPRQTPEKLEDRGVKLEMITVV
ncbi:hypothetical protein CGMCC3_g3402 [Colletotrichum fructicola]|nr:uncharacterized protein CGMCC3_g3402 [Colletotrichum fructicola]KAE9580636.1 hypothetical protein CGMCC3_g3402 [Colletotrichum fructicola]